MKNRSCPDRDGCVFYRYGECETCDMGNRILELNKKISRLKAKTKWISVDERLPEREGYYLTSTIKGVITIGAFFSYYGSSYNPQFKYDVTHWMPLPEPPKMKGEINEQREAD